MDALHYVVSFPATSKKNYQLIGFDLVFDQNETMKCRLVQLRYLSLSISLWILFKILITSSGVGNT